MYFDPELVVQNEDLSIADGAIAPWATMNYHAAGARGARRALQVQPRSAVEEHSAQGAQGDPERLRRRGDRVRLSARASSRRVLARRSRACCNGSIAATRRPSPRAIREVLEALHEHAPVPDLRRRAAQEGKPVRALQRQVDLRSHRDVDQAGARVFRRAQAERAGNRNRAPHPQGNSRAAGFPRRRRPRLPDARSHRRAVFRAARASASGSRRKSARAWSACSTFSTSRRSGCISATTSACSPRSSGCGNSATRCWWSSTIATRCSRPIT